ncbi:hypothetical protein LshimejAT787_0800450 [Lyophyllum shimeji]|uniref:Uncharacterized protein n=1 Tax=Lyophyllum shimeji TaxID=47721 RepID=A0A9P3PRC3_LYOSH|nr:hypothetical protein LshimejAT787_0800450 [Lyophyllum shimeji]
MVAHVVPRHFAKRQDPIAAPTGVGIETGGITVGASNTATTFAFDTAAPTGAPQTAPNLGITTTPVTTIQEPTSSTVTSPTADPSPSTASASSSPIPMSTVVGACVGAFIGAIALIILGLFFYRRYSRYLKERARSRGALGTARNISGEQGRRRSHLEPWNKLEDGDDKWEGMYQAKEVDNVAPMEKLTMFKKSPSVRTAYTHKSDEPVTIDAHPFAQYHPNLAQELASNDKSTDLPIARQFLGRVETGPPISWAGETVGGEPFLSIRSGRVESGTASPTLAMAIPTPPATSSQLHRWESAEVIHYEEPERDAQDSFGSDSERRKSTSNPFFNAKDSSPIKPRSRSNSTRSRSTSVSTVTPAPKVDKGKGRAADENPFADDTLPSFPHPFATNHQQSTSLSSVSSNDRALQSLIAALNISEEQAQERLRVASMQPSFISAASAYTSGGEEEDVTGSFPLPPSTEGTHRELR